MSEKEEKLAVTVELSVTSREFLKELCDFLQLNLSLNKAVGDFEEMIHIPDANCSCHISPPCADCVDWGGLREARSALAVAIDNHTAGAESLMEKLKVLLKGEEP